MRTFSPKPADIQREWHVIDATDVVLGRLAVQTANLLRDDLGIQRGDGNRHILNTLCLALRGNDDDVVINLIRVLSQNR